MAVGRSDGRVTVWNLNSRTVSTSFQCHGPQGVVKAEFIRGEPVLVTAGADNSVKVWVFDAGSDDCRVIRSKEGHKSPPKICKYLISHNSTTKAYNDSSDARTCEILTAGGKDRMVRMFSSARSQLDCEFSQGKGLDKKAREINLSKTDLLLPPVIGVAISDHTKERGAHWGNLVTIHEGSSFGYCWDSVRRSQAGSVLRQDNWNVSSMQRRPPARTNASSVCLSACGNYAVVGTVGGAIYKYNVQSGEPRGTYPLEIFEDDDTWEVTKSKMESKLPGSVKRSLKMMERKNKVVINNKSRRLSQDAKLKVKAEDDKNKMLNCRHHAKVISVVIDAFNRHLVSVDVEGNFMRWNFKNRREVMKDDKPFNAQVVGGDVTAVDRFGEFIAIGGRGGSIKIVDVDRFVVVRSFFNGHSGCVNCVCFGPDGRRMFSSVRGLFCAALFSLFSIFALPMMIAHPFTDLF